MVDPTGEVQFVHSALISSTPYQVSEDKTHAFDGDVTTDFGSNATPGYVGIDLGSGIAAVVTRVLWMPRVGINGSPGYYQPDVHIQGVDPSSGTARYPHFQSSNDNFSTSLNLLPAPDANFYAFERYFHEYAVTSDSGSHTPPLASRYFRIYDSAYYAETAELRFIGNFVTSLLCRPCIPVISPGSGRYTTSQQITITSYTTNALIYYTIDGSTPTTGSTLYSGPFNLPTSTTAEVVIKAIAYQAGCSTTTSEVATGTFWSTGKMYTDVSQATGNTTGYPACVPDDTWDTTGLPVQIHSGSVYWSVDHNCYIAVGFSTWLAQSTAPPSSPGADCDPRGIWMYTSPNPGSSGVFNWTPVTTLDATPRTGLILNPSPEAWQVGDKMTSQTRTRIFRNPSPLNSNKKFVMFNHLDDQATVYDRGRLGVATAPDEFGPWTWQTSIQPVIAGDTKRVNDISLVQDPADLIDPLDATTGAPWIISVLGDSGTGPTNNNKQNYFLKLDPATDYTTFQSSGGNTISVTVFPGANGQREGIMAFNYLGKWIYIHGQLMAYESTAGYDGRYRISTSAANTPLSSVTFASGINGSLDSSIWSSAPTTNVDAVFVAQGTHVFPVHGKVAGSYVLMTDLWDGKSRGGMLRTAGYCWIPIKASNFTLTGGVPTALSIPKNVYSWDASYWTDLPSATNKRRGGILRAGSRSARGY